MKRHILYALFIFIIGTGTTFCINRQGGNIGVRNLKAARFESNMHVMADFVLDSLSLSSNRMVVLTPVMEDKAGNVATFRPLMLTGRNQHYVFLRQGNANYPDALEQRRDNDMPQTIAYDETVKYEPWMSGPDATLRISTDTCGCGNLLGSNLGDPMAFNAPVRYTPNCPFIIPQVEEVPELFVEGAAYVTYELDSVTLKPHLFNNPSELMKIYADIEKVTRDTLLTITSVGIHGFASPEGSYDHNTYLARERAKTLLNWVRKECDAKGVKVGEFKSDFTTENWQGLIDSLSNHPEMANRDAILDIARSDMEPDLRNETIKKKFPTQYRYILKNWYPYLRHADYKVGFRLGQVSLEQIKELIKTRPQVLSLNQMLRAAQSYEVGSEDFREVFDVAVRTYPDDETVNLNAACAAIMSGDTLKAARYLAKAGNSAHALNARGSLALLNNNYAEAETYFLQAQQAGLPEATENLKLLKKSSK